MACAILLLFPIATGTLAGSGQVGARSIDLPAGGESTVDIRFDFGRGQVVGSYGATLTFDPGVLSLVRVEGGDPPFDNPVVNVDGPGGFVAFADAAPGAPTGLVVVLRVTFSPVVTPPVLTSLDLEVTSAFAGGSFENMLPDLDTRDAVACVGDWALDLRLTDPAATRLDWSAVAGAVAYDVIRGVLDELSDDGVVVRLESVDCREAGSQDTTTGPGTEAANLDVDVPAVGRGFYYLVRPVFPDVVGTYGWVIGCDRERTVVLGDCATSRKRKSAR